MSRLSVDDAAVVQEVRAALVDNGLGKQIVSATSALTSAAGGVTLTYTTDDPGITANQAITIADGDSVTQPESIEFTEEINDQIGALRVDVAALRTAVETLRTDGRSGLSPVAVTAVGETTITYTTDDPSITVNGAVVIADGDLTTLAEYHEFCVEANDQVGKLHDDVVNLAQEVNRVITDGWNSTQAVTARTSAVGGIGITWTTDDPGITAGGTTTIADGDLLAVAERNDLIVELEDQIDKVGDDYLAVRTTFEALQALAISL